MKDEKEGFELYLKSVEGEFKQALPMDGFFCNEGLFTFTDKDEGFEFYLKTAEKRSYFSQYRVANYYHDVLKNEEKWFYWNKKAAINGGQFELAEYYIINKNERKALKWYYKLVDENKFSCKML
ncbi:hypothetical protein RclHR1_04260013 [Rhizophagus clarus]|uniref:Kinase-like domain-containing protein n=1 Tax=Rhizophagus clarus TaxID=94130 RepID=A0A2Z6RKN5_9GLOM|nr:hypothetical protein RclHR1_04260013 [Rhizophagus clarus]GES87648.1 kinase-like domain-containing protein [Rhizophagus clarus]